MDTDTKFKSIADSLFPLHKKFHSQYSKKGYIALEAAIILPIFIIAVLTVGFTIKMIYYQECTAFIAMDEGANLAKNGYFMPIVLDFPHELEERIAEELPSAGDVSVERFLYRYPGIYGDNLIRFEVLYSPHLPFPIKIGEDKEIKQTFLLRAFCGKNHLEEASFAQMEISEESVRVYVFPRKGSRYHREDCTYVTSDPVQTVLTSSLKRKYSPCEICGDKERKEGATVYLFQYGDAYHAGSCPTVKKYTITMEKNEAVEKGYFPCLKCGGE